MVPGPVHRSRSDNAVLVPLVVGPWTGSLVTRRAKKLPARAGEIILPGGRMDPSDASWGLTGATVADLRERA